jgi:hypothetical protein
MLISELVTLHLVAINFKQHRIPEDGMYNDSQHWHKVISVAQIIEDILNCLSHLIKVVKWSLNISKFFDKFPLAVTE